jgi:hypothetical protein
LNHQRRNGAEDRRADYHRREPELEFEDVEGQQVERDHVDLKICVDDVEDPHHHDGAYDEFRVLDECRHRGRSS